MENITLDQIVDRMKNHDWSYDYSDDHRVWERGAANQKQIANMVKEFFENSNMTKQELLSTLLDKVEERYADNFLHRQITYMVGNIK
jgi:uncharacterized protein YaaW (UPF0174 family)